jgi:hypothetical protein
MPRAIWQNIQGCTTALSSTGTCLDVAGTACRLDAYKSSACIDDIDNLRCDQEITWPASCGQLHCL